MVESNTFKPGDTVVDNKLRLQWQVVQNCWPDIQISRNGVIVAASIFDLEPVSEASLKS